MCEARTTILQECDRGEKVLKRNALAEKNTLQKDSGFGFSGFGSSEFGIRVSGFRVSGFENSVFRFSGFGIRIFGIRDSQFEIRDSGFRDWGFRVFGMRDSGLTGRRGRTCGCTRSPRATLRSAPLPCAMTRAPVLGVALWLVWCRV